ncbi:glycine betaine ABC transporter substrate-binding protein [Marinilactibacillus psychrotolerans]|uniref:Glycine betaine ABC transport system, glycine betaine-binding protein OpuAC n=1 Tax=Marinilactibacillus psychrotolerans 42ea TaxID=1255609 RepID=A0A1R4ISH7_9LACT|nr:glycine betaine ABC transporter substrate-binding protein [Marinilactibacillus psychrotolerans]GEQ32621.1 glycine betaine/carnitine/choline ABC transporter substrate-binding protein [Marinilactibacillus psychrotolerans]SJN22826.1 Glycine betaine ABC transport system, glycine betaine-binding protein OpuAC [Marinilactibacillus psychrotolerans 42ea]
MSKGKYRKSLTLLPVSLVLLGCESGDAEEQSVDVGEAVEYTLTGIEPGSGTNDLAIDMLDDYDNLEGWEVQGSSTAGMVTSLDQAIKREKPIIVTAWTPHWIFEEYDLKMLEDPKNSLGEEEFIETIARKGLAEEKPNAYAILDNFNWEIEDIQQVMLAAQYVPFEEASANWVDENRDLVEEWTKGSETVDGEPLHLISTPWDTERSSSHVMKVVLEELGYDVDITTVDPVIMFQALATGEGDASLAAWLPITFGSYYEEFESQIDNLGPNMSGALNGLAVPAYMDVDSVEDLPAME